MTVPNSMTMAEAVQLTGMKEREITRLLPVAGGVVIETCDGQRMLWDGSRFSPYMQPDLAHVADVQEPADSDAELAEARAEVERLRAENEQLLEQLAALTDDDAADAEDPGGDPDGPPADPGVELDRLRAEAEALGIKVDGRWGAERLRQAIAEALTP